MSPLGLLSPCVVTKAHWRGCGAAGQFPRVQRDTQVSVFLDTLEVCYRSLLELAQRGAPGDVQGWKGLRLDLV